MFWHWHGAYGFLNNQEVREFESTTDRASSALFGLTFWGAYGGDSLSRFHYDTILENAPSLVRSIDGMHGQGLILSSGSFGEAITDDTYSGERAFLSEFFRWAFGADKWSGRIARHDYPIFEGTGEYSDWEWEKIDQVMAEDISTWLGSDIRSEFSSSRGIADSDLEFTDADIFIAIRDLGEELGEYPRFEDAVSISYPGGSREIADRMLSNYAASLVPTQADSLF